MQGKVTEILDKRQELSIDSKIYKVAERQWEWAQRLHVGDVIEFETVSMKDGAGTIQVISFFRRVGKIKDFVKPEYRQKGFTYNAKNEEWIIRENVLRSAVMFLDAVSRNSGAKVSVETLYALAAEMEKKVKEGF